MCVWQQTNNLVKKNQLKSFGEMYLYTMKRLNRDTPNEELQDIKKGDMVTDTFSKTGLVESIEITDDGLYRIYEFNLVTGRTITVKK